MQGILKPSRLELPASPNAVEPIGEAEGEQEDLYAEASWSPSRWDKMNPVQTPPSRLLPTVASPVRTPG